jgi:endonuclease/exonuclease/phosphatase family metal-dependent hydrolase
MRLRMLAAGLLSTTVIAALTTPVLTAPAQAAGRTTVRVGSFNITSVSFDHKARGEQKRWKQRRPVVVSQILSRRLDVVGLQEANQSSVYRRSLTYGVNQFMDLTGALNARGARYAVTNRNPYNCLRSTRESRCRYRNRGAAQDNRILYNTRTVSLVRQGGVRFHAQTRGKNSRYLAWAVFRSKRTGRQFFFADTHLDPYRTDVRKAQWRETIRNVDRLKRGRQVIVVGDFNTSKFDRYASRFLPAMKRRGYGDVVNQSFRQPVLRSHRARSTRNAWINSYNRWGRNIRPYAYEDAKNKVGNGIDYIFASNRIRVNKWEVVAHVNTRTNRLVGVIPSDHNLVRATLTLR